MKNIKKLRYWKQSILTAVLFSMLLYSCGQQKDSAKLAVFDGGTVTQKEYIDHFLSSTMYKPGLMPSEKNLLDIVFQKAMEKIAVLEAQSRKMDTDSVLVSGAKKIADTNLAQKYMRAKHSAESRARAARLVEWCTLGGGVPGCMHGGGSPDGAKLFIKAFSELEKKVEIAKNLAGITEDIPEPKK